MNHEEQEWLPRFEAVATPEELVELGRKFQSATIHVPTRPHPWAPNKPPLNFAANISAAPLDALADMVRFGGAPPA